MTSQPEVGRAAVSIPAHDKIHKVRKMAGKAVCEIITIDNGQGTGALYHVVDKKNRNRFLLMTCYHVLPNKSLDVIIT